MSEELVIPGTGEVVPPDDSAAVARALDGIYQLQRLLREYRDVLTGLLVDEARRQGTKTLHLPGADVTVSGGTRTVWDVGKLVVGLSAAGLPEERLNEFLRPVVTYKPDGRVARQLSGANPDYARIIDEARTEEPAPWRCKVEVAGGPERAIPVAAGPEQEDG